MGPTKPPTKAQARRLGIITREIGCVACRLKVDEYRAAQAHHIIEGGKRLGHDETIPLCPWHHVGKDDIAPSVALARLGPSLALDKPRFVAQFGSEKELLEITNAYVTLWERGIRWAM